MNGDARYQRVARLRHRVRVLKSRLTKARSLLDSATGHLSGKDTALLAVGHTVEAAGNEWTTTDEVRQFGLTVAYALIEAALSEQPTLPSCFTADDLVLASDVLASEMSQAWR
ncbi:MAG TPA: hypothetical protein PKE64_26040 [Anaerolineae bacterium]|nr:hypothetical protein [Anaerolineae bacterium]